MAARLGLSVSYLSQLETGERPLTPAVTTALARHYPQALAAIEGEAPARRLAVLGEALADPALTPLDADEAARLAEERPAVADRLIALHAAKRAAEERLAIAEESMTTGTGARLPWEAVRDWFHEAGNYVDRLDRAAETLATQPGFSAAEALQRHGVTLATDSDEDAPLARFDSATLTLNAALPPESRRFLIAHRLAQHIVVLDQQYPHFISMGRAVGRRRDLSTTPHRSGGREHARQQNATAFLRAWRAMP